MDAAEIPQVALPARLMFRFTIPCHHHQGIVPGGWPDLPGEHELPELSRLEGEGGYAQVRVGWSQAGLFCQVRTEGKRRPSWCRPARLSESDGLHLLINARPFDQIRRATRFCHHFVSLPFSSGGGKDPPSGDPIVGQLLINRAKEQAPVAAEGLVRAWSTLISSDRPAGSRPRKGRLGKESQANWDYLLKVFIPAAAINGYAPGETTQLGFHYRLQDTEYGEQTLGNSSEFPTADDPSLWTVLDLIGQ